MKFRKFLIASFLLSSSLVSHNIYAAEISKISVKGNHRVESNTIKTYLGLKKGDQYLSSMNNESIRKLYQTQLFNDVSLNFNNGELIIKVSETPLVSKVVFSGNSKIKTSILKSEVFIHQGSSLNESTLKSDVEKIKQLYRRSGRYAVQVKANVETLKNNRATVTFNVTEGPKTSVKNINFVGNHAYKDSELKSVILTKESAWFRFLDSSDTYDPQKVEYDKHFIKTFYTSVGYADARVISAITELSKTKEYFTVTYTIDEGEVFNFADIDIESKIEGVDASDFNRFISIKPGQRYSSSKIEEVIELINNQLSDVGYSGAVTYQSEDKNNIDKTVGIKFIIEKGSKTFIDKINIRGNQKTRDHVIRRQFPISEGDLFNRSLINRGEMNVRNLDYFEKVNISYAPSKKSNNKVDVNVDVEDKSTSSIQFEVGYNSVDGPVGRINFVERNILGSGRYLTAGIDKYKKKTSYHIGVTDPYFMDKDLLVGSSFFSHNSDGSGDNHFKMESVGGSVFAGYDLTSDLRHDINYSFKQDKLTGASGPGKSLFIQEQFGKYNISTIANTLTYDRTDSSIIPKNGYVTSATQSMAGVGGNVKYFKNEADLKIFKSFSDNKYTLKFSFAGGTIQGFGGQKVRINDRFNLGDFSMRGFESSGIGPRVKSTGESLGGQKFYTATAELLFPVGLPKEFNVTGALFVDVGALWDYDIKTNNISRKDVHNTTSPRVSVGAGVLWLTRFAPIRIDYGIPIKKEKYDKKQHWHFRFSTSL